MAKLKTKTTGIPASTRRDPSIQKYRSRTELAARNNRLALIAFAILGVVIALILGSALLWEGVIVPNQAVANVGGQNISTQAYQHRVIFERWRTGSTLGAQMSQYTSDQVQQLLGSQGSPYAQIYQSLEVPTTFGGQVLTEMENELIVQQYAKEHGITADSAAVDEQVFKFFGYAPVPTTPTATVTSTVTPTPLVSQTPTLTPTVTPVPTQTATATITPFPTGIPTVTPGSTDQRATYEKSRTGYFTQVETISGMSESDIQQVFYQLALEDKVKEAVVGKPTTEQEQVKARHILVKTKAEADDAMAALQKGASFANLARSISTDTGSGAKGGELGWAGQGNYVPEFDAAVWNKDTKVGDVVGPIQTQFGYHIIQLEGRETRSLTPDEATQAQTKKFNDWLTAQQTDKKATKYDNWSDRTPQTPTLAQMGLPDYVPPQGGTSPLG